MILNIENLLTKVVILLFSGAVSLVSLHASAEEKPYDLPLLFAGFAFSGDYSNRQDLYPASSAVASEENGALIDRLLREKLQARPSLASRVSLNQSDGKQDVTSVAFSLTQENLEIQKVDSKFWVVVTLQANVLAFNRNSSSVVASYPLRMRFTRVRDKIPDQNEFIGIVREAYITSVEKENILDQWLTRLENVKFKSGARKYLRVTEVTVVSEAEKVITDSGKKISAIKNQVANFLEAAISEKTGVPVVPNSVGEAIGKKIALRFSNGENLQLDLPDADYSVSFTIRDFVSKKLEKSEFDQFIFRTKASISISMADSNRTYLNEGIYDTLIVTLPRKMQVDLNPWDQYYKTLQSLIFSLGKQLSKVDEEWLKDHASRPKEAYPAFLETQKILKDLT